GKVMVRRSIPAMTGFLSQKHLSSYFIILMMKTQKAPSGSKLFSGSGALPLQRDGLRPPLGGVSRIRGDSKKARAIALAKDKTAKTGRFPGFLASFVTVSTRSR